MRKASVSDLLDWSLSARTRIALLLYSWAMNWHHLLWYKVTGKLPVWSVYMVPLFWSGIVAPTNNLNSAAALMGGRRSHSMIVVSYFCVLVVDPVCCHARLRCPFAVAVDAGRYLRTCAEVIAGKPINSSLSSALQSVFTVGENRHWWMNWMVLASVVLWYTLFTVCWYLFWVSS